jgi:hypothetical protein
LALANSKRQASCAKPVQPAIRLLLTVRIFLHKFPILGAQDFWTFADRFAKLLSQVPAQKSRTNG